MVKIYSFTWAIILESMVFNHNFISFYFSYILKKNDKKSDAATSQSLNSNLTQPNLTFPPTNTLCPQLDLNHLPLGCQPCLLPLSHALPSEKTSILQYKYQRYSFQNLNLSMCIKVITEVTTLTEVTTATEVTTEAKRISKRGIVKIYQVGIMILSF